MKNFVFAAVVLASVSLFAQTSFQVGGPADQDLPPGAKVDYVSWCQGDSVMSENRDGEVVQNFDCSDISEGTRCVENSVRKGEWTIVSATCK
ncbi:MAG: hypothetical protein KF767_01240 [Bdellovibrionaceae bacterium]|nr:hypothetical protein [Pseudobdellovibrionaceae bacterium]